MNIRRQLMLGLSLLMLAGINCNAQALGLSSANNSLSENFDSMWTGTEVSLNLPEGWRIDRNLSVPRQVCAWDNATTTLMYSDSENLASNQKNGTYCFGATADNSDRAIGGLSTGSVGGSEGTRGVSLMTKITNEDPSQILTNLKLDYNIEKYRKGSNGAGFSVRLFSSKDGIKWQEEEAFIESFEPDNETLGGYPVPLSTKEVKGNTLRTHVLPGEDLYLAWNISVTSGSTCSSAPGYAIDDIVMNGVFADSDPDWVEDEEEDYDFVPSGIYLRGEINEWGATTEWEFSKVSDTEYALYNKTISGSFKVADAGWSSSCNYGSNGENIVMGVPYKLAKGIDTNISCGNLTFPCEKITLTIEDGVGTLELLPNTSTKGLSAVYMIGDFNGWNYMGTTGKLTLDTDDNLFKGQVALTAGDNGISEWLIYQRLAMAGVWGLETDATAASLQGRLIAGANGKVATTPGMYDVTFNLATGEYTLTALQSIAESLTLSPAAVTLVPQVPQTVKVLSLNNSLIHYNDQAKVFNEIAASMGKDANWTKHTNLGKTLQYHWEEGDGVTGTGEPGAKMMVRSDVWSHIILQEQTILPRTDFAGFSSSVKKWVEYIRDNCPNPNAVIILPLNWALGQDWSNFSDYNKILVDNYTKVAQDLGVVVCPVGLAYQAKYDKDGGENTEASWFLPGDDRHPTLKATYLAALMEYGIIYNEDPATVTYYPTGITDEDKVGEMSDEIAAEMREYASNALKAYKNVVDNHSGTVNFKAALYDQYGIEIPDQTIEWSVTPATASLSNGVFSATEPGEYTVTAKTGNFTATSVVTVGQAETVMPEISFILLNEDNLSYTQDFDSMGTEEEATIPEGWKADVQLSPRTLGSYQNAGEKTLKAGGADFGSSAKNGLWNLGDSSDATDRALGGVTTDVEGGAKSINIYTAIKNDGKKYISALNLGYDIEKYRDGSNPAGFTVKLYTSLDGKNWAEAGADFTTDFEPSDNTIGSSEVPMETRHVAGVLNKEIAPGAELYLAWNISATSGTSCMSAPILSIDNVTIDAELRAVPVYDYYIYIENNSDYESCGLYAWGDSELFGGWPGQFPIDEVTIQDHTFQVFGHNAGSGNYHLIFNNGNNGKQFADYDITGGQDYYLTTNQSANKLEKVIITKVESIIDSEESSIIVKGDTIICEDAGELTVYNLGGAMIARSYGNTLSISPLMPGIYVVKAKKESNIESKKFVKR
ncbi:MAG: T9SS type A sorting domain-containing protein [Muribaculaceae bacterium]|nr:T9SS type A sorting domain-containing protein [Muribaculaceae bacterium]